MRLLTLNDLYDFYSTKKRSAKFDASDSKEPITVQVSGELNFSNSEDLDGLLPVRLQACHTEKNLNKSSIGFDTMKNKLLPSFKNRPILGYIHAVDGQNEFYDHRSHVETDENGEDKLVYDEIAVGVIPESNNAELVYDEENDRYNVMIDGYIFEEYTEAANILKREEKCNVSVEISIRKMSWDAKKGILNIEDGYFSGITILGKKPNGEIVKPGMENSNIKLKDFSQSNNSIFSEFSEEENSKLIETLERLNTTLADFNKLNNNGKEDSNLEDEIKVEQEVEEATENVTEESTEEIVVENETEDDNTETVEDAPAEDEKVTEEESVEDDDEQKFEMKFALSLDEITYALYDLVNTMYAESDNTWYTVRVYDDGTLVMTDLYTNQAYRQSYTKDGENVALSGDRVEVFAEYLTSEELENLNSMRSNYSLIAEKLSKYEEAEAFADKMTVFNDESYAQYLETPEFKELMSDESVKQLSKEELTAKADLLFAKLVKTSGKFSLENKPNEVPVVKAPKLFAFAKQDHECSFLDGLLNK